MASLLNMVLQAASTGRLDRTESSKMEMARTMVDCCANDGDSDDGDYSDDTTPSTETFQFFESARPVDCCVDIDSYNGFNGYNGHTEFNEYNEIDESRPMEVD